MCFEDLTCFLDEEDLRTNALRKPIIKVIDD